MKFFLLKNQISRFFNNIKLKYKLLVSFSILAVFPIIIVGEMSTYYSKKYLVEAETHSLIQSMHQLRSSLDYFFETYMDRTNMIFNSEELQEMIKNNVKSIDVAVGINRKLNKLLGYVENDFRYPEMKNSNYSGGSISTRLYLTNKTITAYEIALPMDEVMEKEWVKQLFEEERAFSWNYGQIIDGSKCISLNRRLVDFDNAEVAGLLQLFIPVSRITDVIKNSVKNDNISIFYMNEGFNQITSAGDSRYLSESYLESIRKMNLDEGVNQAVIGDEKFIIGYMPSNSTKWGIVYLIPLKSVVGKTKVITFITFSTIIAALFVCLIIAYGVSSIITKRIGILLRKTNEISENNLTSSLVIKGNDELSQLSRNFDRMIQRIRNLIENVYVAQIEINQTRLELLQEQINPHLLYNTLSMVAATARKEGQNEIVSVAENLSGFYRGTLNRGKIVYSFREELDMVNRYIEIAKYVYKLDIDTIFEIDDEILNLLTIKLLIQPVIENSILHGIRPKKRGTIIITGSVVNNNVVLVISDDGIGMDGDFINELNKITTRSDAEKSYGIINVVKRIKILLGDNYGLKYSSTPNEGTTVTINLPVLTADNIKTEIKGKLSNFDNYTGSLSNKQDT